MGGKHAKYIYVKRKDGWFVKVRVFKSRPEDDPSRYVIVGPKVREAPLTYAVLDEDELPEAVVPELYNV